MERAISEWLAGITFELLSDDHLSSKQLRLPYVIYGNMLLLRPTAFRNSNWQVIQERGTQDEFEQLYQLIAKHLKVTHIAVNRPIPAVEENSESDNILRAPINFTPLYGDFGPATCSYAPSPNEFDSAFWVTAKQNGIYQTWAPRWTMFSRGNISEKARLLTLSSVEKTVSEGRATGKGCCAVDLYAGVGYFAFSYIRAGFDQVLCWDLNPWSIEGLRKGAAANGWSTRVLPSCEEVKESNVDNAKLLIFNESNEAAVERVKRIKGQLPPIRHVNCGLLPTSRGSWRTALRVVDFDLGGWIHVHENFSINEIESRAEEVRDAFQEMLGEVSTNGIVQIEFISRLKSYAPGVMHCVIDLRISPRGPG